MLIISNSQFVFMLYVTTLTLKGEVSKLAEDGGAITKLQRAMEATIKSTVKHLKARFCSLLGKCTPLSYELSYVSHFIKMSLSLGTTESATTKAVKCCNIFNHDSSPED